MKDITKAMAWGATLLVLILTIVFSVFVTLMHFSHTITKAELAANQHVTERIVPTLRQLNDIFYNANDRQEIELRQSQAVKDAIDSVRNTVVQCKNCSDLESPYFSDWMSYDRYADYIKSVSDPENVSSINLTSYTLSFIGLLAICLGIYLLSALIKFKTLKFDGVFLFFSLIAPIYVLAYAASVSMEYTTKFGAYYSANGFAIQTFMYTFLALFVIYPPAIITAKKRGIRLLDLLKLSRIEGAK